MLRDILSIFMASAQKVVLVMSCAILIHILSTSDLAKQGSWLVNEALFQSIMPFAHGDIVAMRETPLGGVLCYDVASQRITIVRQEKRPNK